MKASVAKTLVLSLALTGAVVAQDTFEVTISGDESVAVDGTVSFEISGEFTSTTPENMGLAFFSIDLEVVGPQGVELSTALTMETGTDVQSFFAPLGYSIDDTGTAVGNDLVQAGGGQNTINNDPAAEPFEPFPSGAVVEDIGLSGPVVLFDNGMLTIPGLVDGQEYTLQVKAGSLHANAITGFDGNFYSVDAVNVSIGSSLTFTVDECDQVAPRILAADEPDSITVPCSGYIDPRGENLTASELVITFSEEVVSLNDTPVAAADFVVTSTGSAPGISAVDILDGTSGAKSVRITLDAPLPIQQWTTIKANVKDLCDNVITDAGDLGNVDEEDRIDIGFLPGDIDQNGQTSPLDVFAFRVIINSGLTDLPANACSAATALDLGDIRRDGDVGPLDLFYLRRLINGQTVGAPLVTQSWATESLPPRP